MKWIAVAAVLLCGLVTVSAEAADAGALSVENAWARASAGKVSGAFLTIHNDGDADRLVSVSTDAAQSAKVHATAKEGDVMKMRPVDGIDVPAHGSVELQPGGYHIMLIGLKHPLKDGDSVPLTLHFQKGGTVDVAALVKKPGAGQSAADHQHMMMDHGEMPMDHMQMDHQQ